MNTMSLVWIIVGIVVVLIIVGVIIYFARKRNQEHAEQQRIADKNQAAELRQNAQKVELDARENEAKASRARADAEQAEVDAERLRQESAQRAADAQDLRVDSNEQARKAETLDPTIDSGRSRGESAGTTPRADDDPSSPIVRGDGAAGNPRHGQSGPGEDSPQTDVTGGRDR
ncbi:hypothetical protein GCM10022381_20270 [Leifsonia kafniensis]|uniref:Uncharacterized protein n=1 Tax=Leifsonia kafniensis TaxID=475957 RepID=A0ABP7KJD5_9MICO